MINQKGFSLIEVAIAVFIIAVGLLGLASLQFMSLKNMAMAQRADQASIYLQEIAEAMRSNASSLETFIAATGPVGENNAIGCEINCGYAVSAEAEINRIKNAIATTFDTPELTIIRESNLGSYSRLDADGAAISITTDVYKLELTWLERGSFLLRSDTQDASDNITKIQSMKVVL